MHLRELEPGEEPLLLDLLDGWPFRDGRLGREVFRRYLEDDPAYQPANVLVAEHARRLVSGVQIFPRTLRTARGEASCGGIGSVFTAPEHRHRGIASELLRRAIQAMEERGMALSLLLAARIRWYSALGWRELSSTEVLLEPTGTEITASGRVLTGEQDLEQVAAIAAVYGAQRAGSVARDHAGWETSLRLAGDPDETFLVSGPGRTIDAYLRLAQLDGAWRALEWGCVPQRRALLAELLLANARERVVLPPLRDDELESELRARRARLHRRPAGASWMVRPLTMSETEVAAVLPADRFSFWPADRF
jgi:GNAT superfamily N-acetyltransferase